MIKKRPSNAREVSAFTLISVREYTAYSDVALNYYLDRADLTVRDRALCARIVYGTLQNKYMCDFYISKYSKIRLKKINLRVLDIMEMAVYQMVFMDKIPESAAVNESIELIKKYAHANPRTVGFANGVLRSVARSINNLPKLNCKDKEEFYSINYSTPQFMTKMFIEQFGLQDTKKLLEQNNKIAPLCVRVNKLKTDVNSVLEEIERLSINVEIHDRIDNLILCDGASSMISSELFKNGKITIQDGASITAVDVLNPTENSTVIDCCAAPGGKSFYISEKMKNTGEIISCDVSEKKIAKIQEGALRLNITNIKMRVLDASIFSESLFEKADFLLCDVPCSAIGIIRKKPEIRYKSDEGIKDIPLLQLKILNNVSKYLKKGGELVYSTCTILKRENEDVIEKFLKQNNEFELQSFETKLTGKCDKGYITLLPHTHNTDGFFIAKLKKI